MNAYAIAFNSSSGNPHHVAVTFLDDGRVAVSCSCPGSQMGKLCKHRIAIVQGDDSLVVDEHKGTIREVVRLLGDTLAGAAYREYLFHLDGLDDERKAINAREAEFKKGFARLLTDGI